MDTFGFTRNRDQMAHFAFGKGMPRGYHCLIFTCWVGLVLSGSHFPYAAVAIAGTLLTLAWGLDKQKFPIEKADRS